MRWITGNNRNANVMRTLVVAIGCIVSMGMGLIHPPSAWAGSTAPFSPGERLKFRLRWALVPAGQATMEVLPMKTIDGQNVYHFRLTADSNAFVDMFYKVRDRIDAYASANMTHAVRYQKKQHEGDTRRNVKVEFDSQADIASFNDGKKEKEIEIVPGTFDPLSAFYYTRMFNFKESGIIQCPVSDGKKCVTGMARIVKKETITILSGTYETFLIEPDLKHVGGVFEKDKNAKIKLWVTADEQRIPVKIASKVAVGSFVGELMSIESGDS
jgi:hypothetical protein